MPRWLLITLVALGAPSCLAAVALPLLLQAFVIPSGSMAPTLTPGDCLFTSRAAYDVWLGSRPLVRLGDPQHGDVATFRKPGEPAKVFIQRVIGVPGDTIEILDKAVFRNGEALAEPYAQHTDPNVMQGPRDNRPPFTLQAVEHFVMGDDRDDSLDSRFFGPVFREDFLGKAWILYAQRDATGLRFDNLGKRIR